MRITDKFFQGCPMDGERVTAADIVRNFSAVRQRALADPVYITNHGRDSHVLCSVERFGGLLRGQGGEAGPLTLDLMQLAACIDQALIVIDRPGHIVHINAALLSILPRDPACLIGKEVFAALPELETSIAGAHLRRAIACGERAQFEIKSPFQTHGWLRCRIQPIGDQIALLFTDISSAMRSMQDAAEQAELLKAMDLNRHTGFVRLSVRGYIQHANAAFAELLGISEDQLVGMHFCRLADAGARLTLGDELEGVLGQGRDVTLQTQLLHASGELVDLRIGMACVKGLYGHDGAVLVVSALEAGRPGRLLRSVG